MQASTAPPPQDAEQFEDEDELGMWNGVGEFGVLEVLPSCFLAVFGVS